MKKLHRLKRKILYYFTKKDYTFYSQFGIEDQDIYEITFEVGDMQLYKIKGNITGVLYYFSSYIKSTSI